MKFFCKIPKNTFIIDESQLKIIILENNKQKQLDIILKNNPADDVHFVNSTWIRSTEDILSFEEMLADAKKNYEEYGDMEYPDTTIDDYLNAEKTGKITVYSSYPIKPGIFVSPSRMCAYDYAGGNGNKVYSKVVPVNDVAWIDQGQGQYAPLSEGKTIILNSLQIKQINEAMDDSFSFDELNKIPSFNGRLQYCKQHFGQQIGSGSSRIVFQIDDNKVLKLAKNQKGIAQNETEADWGAQSYDVVPELFNVADDYIYIVSEYVLPAKPQDFSHCLGMTFEEFCEFVKKSFLAYASNRDRRSISSNISNEQFETMLDNNEWLYSFRTYMADFQVPYGDLTRLANYGLCNRNGEAQIVLLDSGLTQSIYDEYYKRR